MVKRPNGMESFPPMWETHKAHRDIEKKYQLQLNSPKPNIRNTAIKKQLEEMRTYEMALRCKYEDMIGRMDIYIEFLITKNSLK